MPGLGGIEFCEKLVEIDANTRILFMSGYSQQAEIKASLQDGNVVGFLQKPFDLSLFATTVRKALDRIEISV